MKRFEIKYANGTSDFTSAKNIAEILSDIRDDQTEGVVSVEEIRDDNGDEWDDVEQWRNRVWCTNVRGLRI